jgi:hypothetical protein
MRQVVVICAVLGGLVSLACSFSVSVGNVPGKISGEPEFGDVVLATEVDQVSKEPVTEVVEFRADVEEMHAAINVKNVRAGSEFRFRWKRGREELASIVINVPVDLVDAWVEGYIEPTEDVPVGRGYSVDVLFNDDIVSSTTFSVVKN